MFLQHTDLKVEEKHQGNVDVVEEGCSFAIPGR